MLPEALAMWAIGDISSRRFCLSNRCFSPAYICPFLFLLVELHLAEAAASARPPDSLNTRSSRALSLFVVRSISCRQPVLHPLLPCRGTDTAFRTVSSPTASPEWVPPPKSASVHSSGQVRMRLTIPAPPPGPAPCLRCSNKRLFGSPSAQQQVVEVTGGAADSISNRLA